MLQSELLSVLFAAEAEVGPREDDVEDEAEEEADDEVERFDDDEERLERVLDVDLGFGVDSRQVVVVGEDECGPADEVQVREALRGVDCSSSRAAGVEAEDLGSFRQRDLDLEVVRWDVGEQVREGELELEDRAAEVLPEDVFGRHVVGEEPGAVPVSEQREAGFEADADVAVLGESRLPSETPWRSRCFRSRRGRRGPRRCRAGGCLACARRSCLCLCGLC